jgi:hypothetical protein
MSRTGPIQDHQQHLSKSMLQPFKTFSKFTQRQCWAYSKLGPFNSIGSFPCEQHWAYSQELMAAF